MKTTCLLGGSRASQTGAKRATHSNSGFPACVDMWLLFDCPHRHHQKTPQQIKKRITVIASISPLKKALDRWALGNRVGNWWNSDIKCWKEFKCLSLLELGRNNMITLMKLYSIVFGFDLFLLRQSGCNLGTIITYTSITAHCNFLPGTLAGFCVHKGERRLTAVRVF